MAQPAADARKRIRSLLERMVEHEVKMKIAGRVDAKSVTSFQTSRDHWQKEIEGFWREIERENQTRWRRRGQFFSDDEIIHWKGEFLARGIKLAVNRLVEDRREHEFDADARWLRKIAEELYD
jgi:hypothetical protein